VPQLGLSARTVALAAYASAIVAVSVVTVSQVVGPGRSAGEATITLPPVRAGFDYQIGGQYPPPAGVRVVVRDRAEEPAAELYNICYVNAFQAQSEEQEQWESDLLLRDAAGDLVIDEDWDEPLLDLRTADKRKRIAATLNGWIDDCADKGFQAIEPDNYDSYTRSKNLLTAGDAKEFLKLLADHAHARRLAIGQKNTAELAGDRRSVGLDFAVAEECGEYDECGVYADAFDDHVVVIEYTNAGRRNACAEFGDRLSVVQRDRDVTTPGSPGYVRKAC